MSDNILRAEAEGSRHFEFYQKHSRYLFFKNKPIQLSKPKVPRSFHYPTKNYEILPHFRPNEREGPLKGDLLAPHKDTHSNLSSSLLLVAS